MIAILLAPVYLLANYYLLRRVMGWVKAWFPFFRTARHWALPVAVQAFLACSIVIAFFLPEGRARRVMKLIGNYWLGVLLYVLLAIVAADLLRLLLGYALPFKHIFVTTKMHRIAGCLCALAILTASLWGVVNARIIHVTPYDVTIDKSVAGMDEMKVVLVADLHLGYNIGEHDVTWLVLFGVTDDFTARYADLADDGLRSAQSTAPALYAVTNVDGRIYLTAK